MTWYEVSYELDRFMGDIEDKVDELIKFRDEFKPAVQTIISTLEEKIDDPINAQNERINRLVGRVCKLEQADPVTKGLERIDDLEKRMDKIEDDLEQILSALKALAAIFPVAPPSTNKLDRYSMGSLTRSRVPGSPVPEGGLAAPHAKRTEEIRGLGKT